MKNATDLLYERIVMLEAAYNEERDRADRLEAQLAAREAEDKARRDRVYLLWRGDIRPDRRKR